jgi:hypothetical protein
MVERLADELFADVRPVRVGGVDEVDAELDRAAQHRLRLVAVSRRTPDTVTGDTHGAEAEAVHRKVAAHIDRSGILGVERLELSHGS